MITEPATDVGRIPVSDIDTPLANHRLGEEDVGELAASIEVAGLLQRIRVYRHGDRFRLAFGHRRLAACRSLEMEQILAEIFPEESWDETAIRQQLAIENIQRSNLDPVEEALAVSQLVEQVRTDNEKLDPVEAEQLAAELLGRPYSWVARRMRLRDLDAKVLDQLRAGGMSLGHAIELAKLADPKEQRTLARGITWGENERHQTRASDVHQQVSRVMLTLRGVPWRLDVPFAGAPACIECPHNSEQRLALFGSEKNGDGAQFEPIEGRCTKPSCFRKKRKTAEADVKRAAAKISDRGMKATEKSAVEVARPYTKPATVARAARKLVDEASPAKSKTTKKPDRSKKKPRSANDVKWSHDRKHNNWSRKCEDTLHQAILAHPDLLLWFVTATLLPPFFDATEGIDDPAWRKIRPHWNAGRGHKADAKLAATLEVLPKPPGPGARMTDTEVGGMLRIAAGLMTDALKKNPKGRGYHELFQAMPTIVAQQLVEVLGIELPPPPKIPEQLLKKPAAKKKPKTKTKKKRRRRRAAKA